MIQNSNFLTALQLQEQYKNSQNKPAAQSTGEGLSFQDVLLKQSEVKQADSTLKFSKHASTRLEQRGINLTSGQMKRLEDATTKASQKGIKDSLVIVDELAFIVNVPNHTVVTALNSSDTGENVFTNIDGAVFM